MRFFRCIYLLLSVFCCVFFVSACQTDAENSDTEVALLNQKNTPKINQGFKPFEANTADGVLATVGDGMLLLSDLQKAVLDVSPDNPTRILPTGQLRGGVLDAKAVQAILDNLITTKVLEAKAVEQDIKLTDDELSARINDFLRQRNLTEDQLKQELARTGTSMADYRKQFKDQVIREQVIGRVITPLVSVTDDEIKAFYLQQNGEMKQVQTVTLRSLMISLPDNAPLVQVVQNAVNEKQDFTQLVKRYSAATNAAIDGGLLAPKSIDALPGPLKTQIAQMKVGDVAGPFTLGNSAFFFQYVSVDFVPDSDFQRNYNVWRSKLLDIKFSERLKEYLANERDRMQVRLRPLAFYRLPGL